MQPFALQQESDSEDCYLSLRSVNDTDRGTTSTFNLTVRVVWVSITCRVIWMSGSWKELLGHWKQVAHCTQALH